jgi:LEA14-like dessication related protein
VAHWALAAHRDDSTRCRTTRLLDEPEKDEMTLKRILLVLALVVVGACAAAFRQPVVTLDTIGLESIGLRGGRLVAHVHIENPNGYDLRSEGLRYTIEVAEAGGEDDRTWRQLATGEFDDEIRVPADGSARVEIPIEFDFDDVGSLIRPMLDRGVLDYRVSGTVDVEDPITRTVPYQHSGQVSLSGVR